MDGDERQRKVEAGRAMKPTNMQRNKSLASFRQRRAKVNGTGASKKTQKGKGPAVAQNDRSAQDRPLEAPLQTDSGAQGGPGTDHERSGQTGQRRRAPELRQSQGRAEACDAQERSLLMGEVEAAGQPGVEDALGEEDLATLTGKEQLKQLQHAVERRNEIITRLSSNLQEALVSRDQVQLEVQSLAGQIQDLQVQLQQASQYLQRSSKTQAGSRPPPAQQQPPEPGPGPRRDPSPPALNHHHHRPEEEEEPAFGCTPTGSASPSAGEESEAEEADAQLARLRRELEEEQERHRRALHLLEEERRGREEERRGREEERRGREEERTERERQLADLRTRLDRAQSQTRELLRYKQEKEEEEREGPEEQREEGRRLGQLLEEGEGEVEKESACEDEEEEEEEDGLNVSVSGGVDPLMERYLSSVPPPHTQSSFLESLEEHHLLESSERYSFELDSEVLGDQSQALLSHSLGEAPSLDLLSYSVPRCTAAGGSPDQEVEHGAAGSSPSRWLQTSAGEEEEEGGEEAESDLGKELLIQQCGDLREELLLREREQEVLREEVQRSADELQEARDRWAQATEELQEALWRLQEEREQRRRAEEEINVKTHEEDNLKNRLSALLEERESASRESESSPLPASSPPVREQERVREAREEKAALLARLKQQEQLVSSLQERKQAGDSLTSEVQGLFGKQLQALQAHRDQALAELEESQTGQRTTAALLGQRSVELERARREAQERGGALEEAARARAQLEAQLLCLEQNLRNLEEALAQGVREREEQRRRLGEELEEVRKRLGAKDEEVAEEREKWELERQEKEEEARGVRRLLEEQRREREEEVRALLEGQVRAVEEATGRLRRSHGEEVQQLQEKHREEVQELTTSLEAELVEQKAAMEEEQRRQISLIKQVTEREHQRMMSEQSAQQREELERLRAELSGELRESMESAHQAEIQQTRAQQSLEMEALRLSLTNLHAAQLELSQANLQREREAALGEAQACLRERWAQESAVLQARQHLELERVRGQSQEEGEEHRRSLDELKQECESRVSKERASMEEQQANQVQALRLQWQQESESLQSELQTELSDTQNSLTQAQASLTETQASLTQTQASLTETQAELSGTQASLTQVQAELSETQAELSSCRAQVEELRASSQNEIQRLEEELSQAWTDRDSAARAVEDLVSSHKKVLQEREEHARQLEDREKQLQQEVERAREEQASLRQSSGQEAAHLWAQLENMRTSRQELGELKEQLLARSSRVDDIERLKAEFSEQKRDIREQNEAELENLRRYFEQRLRAAEEGYREEIALLQLRLVEGALEDSVLKTGDASFMSDGKGEEERNEMLAEITLKLEKHKEDLDALRVQLEDRHTQELSNLRSSMALSYREELLQVRSDLTDRYYDDLQELKTRHALELEQLRAKLSDGHVRELTRIRLEAARQVEVEVEQRSWGQREELQSSLTVIQTLESRLDSLTQQHTTELQGNAQQRKQEFCEELSVRLEEVREEERQRGREEQARRSQEEAQGLREELQQQEEERLSALRQELEEERRGLEEQLEEERERLRSLQASLDNDQNPQVLAAQQRLRLQYDSELSRAKSCMASEVKELSALLQEQGDERLRAAQERHQEERGKLEQCLAQQREQSLGELSVKHQADLELQRTALLTDHARELDALRANHKAELDELSAGHRGQIAATVTELGLKHKAEVVALETSLESRREAELDRLEAVLEETNQAQLEAQEAELERRHQEDKEELERRMLGNMDTLEATYLKEIQTLREAGQRLGEAQRQEVERERAEQLSIGEHLKKELAQMHMEKFGAMATELSHAHQTELAIQREALEAGHRLALEALRNQVLELEQQHSAALQELAHTYSTEENTLTTQHQLQLQELRGASARELEACRRELEEESSRQRLHFMEEVELLNVQSEERLQERISQIKAEFEEQKEAELDEQRRSFSSEREQKERGYTEKMSQLTSQLQQLDTVVSQLRAEVGCLQGELEGKRLEMETLDALLQRRDRETQEGSNLLAMLTDDLQAAGQDRHELQLANEKLRKVLLEVVRSTMATEELIGRRVSVCVGMRGHHQGAESGQQTANQKSSEGSRGTLETGVSVVDMSSSELELSQRLCESFLQADGQLPPGGEEAALHACVRLRHTVDTLLELLNQANTQLLQTHGIHLSLEERFSQGKEDSAQLLQQHTLLLEQLDQEAALKSQLQLELHKAKGLLEGYVAEKAALEESLQQKESQEERLGAEVEGLRARLLRAEGRGAEAEGLRARLQELGEENALLLRQRDHLSAGLGEREKGLLAETERLAQERLDVQRQAEKDQGCLALRLRALEAELEEQESRGAETESRRRAHADDLGQRVQALEKQLKHNRQFIDEQAVEREHERDEFQQEIVRLEARLRHPARAHSAGDPKGQRIEELVLQVESLQALIRDKTEDHASLLVTNQQAQLDVAERNEEIDKLAGRIRELEQALLSNAENSRAVAQLEQELLRAKQREQELTQDKQALEQQQLSSRLQISALQSTLDEARHRCHDAPDPTQPLRDALDTAQQNQHRSQQQVEALIGQLEQAQRDLTIKEVELKHLTLQLEHLTNHNAEHVSRLQDEIATLKEAVSSLTLHQEEREEERDEEEEEEESLPSALLQEKNQEIDHLNQEIQSLQQEVENTKSSTAAEAELDDLRSQLEHLDCDLIRLRQDKREEEERLHEVISTLQAELATLGPALHEVSDSQEGDDSANPSPPPSPSPAHHHHAGQGDSLKQELRLLHPAASPSLRSRAEALRGQLEVAAGEKEALERLLLTQEQEYRGQGEELGRRLREEREKGEELRRLLSAAEAELEEARGAGRGGTPGDDDAERAGRDAALLLEAESLRARGVEREMEAESLREAALALERQVREARAAVVAAEKLVADGRAEAVALETAKAELSEERQALRTREARLQEEIERLAQEVTSLRRRVQELSLRLEERVANQEEAQKEVLTNAEATLAKADAALRQKEAEIARLGAEHQALKAELAAVKEGLSSSTERAEKLQEEGQTKDRALASLETNNQRLKAELRSLQDDLAVQEEELAYQQRELRHLREELPYQQRELRHLREELPYQQRERDQLHTPPHSHTYSQKDVSPRAFQDALSPDDASLSSPEVLRRLECTGDRTRDGFHASVLQGSRLSDLSVLSRSGLELLRASGGGCGPEPPRSTTITPEPAAHTTRSPGSVSASDNLSVLDSIDDDKVRELEALDLTAPSSPLGSASSLSAPEWASDGYGSNVSSELGLRLRVELEQTERLDAQFVQYLRCRGMNPAANTDSAAGSMSYRDELLSPELQGLLTRVYQESCRVLSLSQRRHTSSSQPLPPASKALPLDQARCQSEGEDLPLDRACAAAPPPPRGWQQEKRALQETVIALRELMCRMAQRDTQVDSRDEGAVPGEAELQLREELEQSRQQISSALNTQQELHNHTQELRRSVQDSEEALRREQSRVQELQQNLQQERTHTHRLEREDEERREAVRVSAEQQGSEVVTLRGQLEQEKVTGSNLRRELQIEQSRGLLLQSQLEARQRQLDSQSQASGRQESLLRETEADLTAAQSQVADAHRALEEERRRWRRELDAAARAQEADAARDRKFVSDLRSQLEQERAQGEELAAAAAGLRAELLQSRRRGEEEDGRRREESQRERETAAARLRVAAETLKEQKQEAGRALEAERERCGRQGAELKELREKMGVIREKEREREEQRERERRKERQEQAERERRHERTCSKLGELELLRQQDQQRVQALQQTLAELDRDERERTAAQRLALHPSRSAHRTGTPQPGPTPSSQQSSSSSSSSELVEKLLRENGELSASVAALSQERVALKHALAGLERRLRRSENELARVAAETENRPAEVNNGKVQRLYERYLRAESFRKSLVYQKRYLLLLLAGFQDCERATLGLIACMGAHPSAPPPGARTPLSRFRTAVRAVLAISRLKFLTRKWQRAIKRGVTTSITVNGHVSGSRTEVLRQQHPGANHNASPPTRDGSPPAQRGVASTLVPPIKSPFRLHHRVHSSPAPASERSGGLSQDGEPSLTEYIHHLENVQQRLGGRRPVSQNNLAPPPSGDERGHGQAICSPDMIGYRQRWLQENRTWLYLSCLSPLYLRGAGCPTVLSYPQKSDH